MNKPHHESRGADRGGRRRHRRDGQGERRHHHVPLTDEGFPAAAPDAPKPSAVVFVSDESRAKHPWLPPRVIAGSIWRGPQQERVRVDESGVATVWKSGPAAGR